MITMLLIFKLNLLLRLILALKSYRPFHELCGSLIRFEVSSPTISHGQRLFHPNIKQAQRQ